MNSLSSCVVCLSCNMSYSEHLSPYAMSNSLSLLRNYHFIVSRFSTYLKTLRKRWFSKLAPLSHKNRKIVKQLVAWFKQQTKKSLLSLSLSTALWFSLLCELQAHMRRYNSGSLTLIVKYNCFSTFISATATQLLPYAENYNFRDQSILFFSP